MRQRWHGLLAALLVIGTSLVAAHAAGAAPRPLVFVAVELQPEDPSPGGQFIWIRNRSQGTVDLGCWRLRSRRATLWVAPALRLPRAAAVSFTAEHAWLGQRDRVQLINRAGQIVDATPEIKDLSFDDKVWFRTAAGDWRFGRTRLSGELVHSGLLEHRPGRC